MFTYFEKTGLPAAMLTRLIQLAAFRFEQVLKQVKAKYIIGLTATPIRKDGHHPIIIMQCGPIRYRVRPKEQAVLRQFVHQVVPRYTDFEMQVNEKELTIQEIYSALILDVKRNDRKLRNKSPQSQTLKSV